VGKSRNDVFDQAIASPASPDFIRRAATAPLRHRQHSRSFALSQITRPAEAKQQHHAAALDDNWTDFSAYSISWKTISEKWAMLDAGVHVRDCSARRSTRHC
jgi:hypothetical protein